MTEWKFTTIKVEMTVAERHTVNILALLLLPVLCFIGLIGNALVCIAISTDRRLHNVTNYFLFSLALADLLVCCIVMPLSIVVEVRHGVWIWNVSMCLVYTYSDVFLCSASIVHMSVISLDRYLGISKPLSTRNKSKTMILLKIALVWVITFFVSCPLAILAIHNQENILQNNTCMIYNQYYIVYGSTLTFLIPFCVMAVTYYRTTYLLNKQASILSQRANDKLNGNGLRRTMPHRKLGYTRTNSATANGFPILHKSSGSSISHKSTIVMYNTQKTSTVTDVDVTKLVVGSNNGVPVRHKSLTKTSSAINKWKSRTSSYISSIASRVGRRNSLQAASQELANEHKATRVLAVVFICFFICWTPFFVTNFILGFCGAACSLPPWLGSLFLWLGYISSTINPIIYTVFNKRFRQAFVRILRCQCFHSLRDAQGMYSRNYTTVVPDTYTWSNHERAISVSGREAMESNGFKDSWRRENSIERQDKKISLHSAPVSRASTTVRDSRATTEENTSDDDQNNEQKPLISQRAPTALTMKKSFSTIIAQGATSPTLAKSSSTAECRQCNGMTDSTDTETTTGSSMTSSCNRHMVLFNTTMQRPFKETFL